MNVAIDIFLTVLAVVVIGDGVYWMRGRKHRIFDNKMFGGATIFCGLVLALLVWMDELSTINGGMIVLGIIVLGLMWVAVYDFRNKAIFGFIINNKSRSVVRKYYKWNAWCALLLAIVVLGFGLCMGVLPISADWIMPILYVYLSAQTFLICGLGYTFGKVYEVLKKK